MNNPPEITIRELIDRYQVLLLDAYGVLVHSAGVLPGAAKLIDHLNQINKPYFIVTNDAAKLPATAAARYQKRGLAIKAERIISSGLLLTGYFAENALVGKRCVVLGPKDSLRYVEQAGGKVVPPADDFDVFVINDEGDPPFFEVVDPILTTLFHKLDRHEEVHLILSNPDLIYPRGDKQFGFTAGSVALMFETAFKLRYPHRPDLRFARLGKPHTTIFAEALRRTGSQNMVMVGDQLATDIRGANTFGLDSVLVTNGVTALEMADLTKETRPTYVLRSLEV